MLRGSAEELIEICYFVYDMNGDRSLAREELYQCLKGIQNYYKYQIPWNSGHSLSSEKPYAILILYILNNQGCMSPGYGLDSEDMKDAEKDIV